MSRVRIYMQLCVLQVLLQYQTVYSWNHNIIVSIRDQRRSLDVFELTEVGLCGNKGKDGS